MDNIGYKQIGEYKIREIPNPNGKSIEETLQELFIAFCTEKMQKQLLG